LLKIYDCFYGDVGDAVVRAERAGELDGESEETES
jgi:hypothetical protein